ncbi:Cys-tRNA(Pro) deacylase [Sphingobacterium spiritivorum]|uniref:Cys-tRNA(Pro) deacylase n=1 Tax=Sphingobacterium spiritivorum TaxID=258 RepID=UPI003DA38C44
MSNKTNAVRMLDQLKVNYEVREYDVDEDDLSAGHVAESLGLDPKTLYKTLVLKGNAGGYLVAVIPGDTQLDLKKIAKASGNKNCEMIPVKDIQTLTGYIRGGCSPIGMKKAFPTYIEQSVQIQTAISISAGKRGLQIILSPQDLVKVTNARYAELI